MSAALEAEVDRLLMVIAAAEAGSVSAPVGVHSDDLIERTAAEAAQACVNEHIGKAASRVVKAVCTTAATSFAERLNEATALEVALLGLLIDLTGNQPEIVLRQLIESYGKEG
jgi:hypothetical protein